MAKITDITNKNSFEYVLKEWEHENEKEFAPWIKYSIITKVNESEKEHEDLTILTTDIDNLNQEIKGMVKDDLEQMVFVPTEPDYKLTVKRSAENFEIYLMLVTRFKIIVSKDSLIKFSNDLKEEVKSITN